MAVSFLTHGRSSTRTGNIGVLLLCCFFFTATRGFGQSYDLLIKNGRLIDPRNGIAGPMDVAIAEGKIAQVADNIPARAGRQVVDATGLIVTPGLIDIHTHVFVGPRPNTFANGFSSVSPDDFSFRSGVTTVVDAGTSGWRNFRDFKAQVIDHSRTRVLAFLNIAGGGMMGSPYEQNVNDMDSHMTSLVIEQYADIIVGTTLGHYHGYSWTPFDRALEAGKVANVPLLLECHLPNLPLENLLGRMRAGDIFTHAYGRVTDRDSILDEDAALQPFVLAARQKGVHFDVGHGGGSFHFSTAIPATKQGFWPDSFGTDLHRSSMNSGMKDMLNIMSKFLNMGMAIEDIIDGASWNPAQAIKRVDIGHLSEGTIADVAVLRIREGNFGFVDSGGNRLDGKRKLEAELTLRAGRVVWDLNGLAAKRWEE
jgi:dihydroorotase